MAADDSSDYSSVSVVTANLAKKEKGSPVSVITSLEHVFLFSSSSKKATQTCDDQRKRKIPHLIDFFSSAHKYDEKKVHDRELADVELSLGVNPEISISTELSLWFGPPNMKKKRKMVVVPTDDDYTDLSIAPPLNLNIQQEWQIKKTLKRSDIDGSSRLLLGKALVQEHILPHLRGVDISEAEGTEIAVWDVDTRTEHVLVLKQWSSGSFVMTKNWMSGFVKRRGLKENHEIRLRWDDENSRLEFTVLHGIRKQ